MSTVVAASYAPVCRSPVLPVTPAPNLSWRPAVAAFPSSAAVKYLRPPLFATRALPEKQRPAFSIPPTALLFPVPPPDVKERRWDIREADDHVKLWFQVPGLSEEDLEITAGEDMLEIKRKGAARTAGGGVYDDEVVAEVHGVGSFHVRLLMTKEYDSSNITAELKAGMLEVTVGKSKSRRINKVGFGPSSPAQPAKSPVAAAPAKERAPNSSPNQAQRDSVNAPAQIKSPKEESGSR